MRGKKAKQIRKVVYGDMSQKAPRKYAQHRKTGQIINTGLRARYLKAKKNAGL